MILFNSWLELKNSRNSRTGTQCLANVTQKGVPIFLLSWIFSCHMAAGSPWTSPAFLSGLLRLLYSAPAAYTTGKEFSIAQKWQSARQGTKTCSTNYILKLQIQLCNSCLYSKTMRVGKRTKTHSQNITQRGQRSSASFSSVPYRFKLFFFTDLSCFFPQPSNFDSWLFYHIINQAEAWVQETM